ncbi:GL22467 [Drosophila persimilis]|uniref:GL22467 n=1 Tax=Drosophila persimilis TaxID=7234 RepID=B4HA06_DROPE|nr:GL22467 [Drosophila persimilis]
MRRRLLETFGESEDSKMRRLLRGGDMTGKPSEILLHLRRLSPASGCDLTELPSSIRPLISVWEENDLDKLAKIVNKMIENNAIDSMCVMSTQPNSADHIQQSVDAPKVSHGTNVDDVQSVVVIHR